MLEFGHLASRPAPKVRLVLFAGEVFPPQPLRELVNAWSAAEFFNLYGPTETNVCTFAAIPNVIPPERNEPYPIGQLCDHCLGIVLDEDGREVALGCPGLLHIAGPAVFKEYWNRPDLDSRAFFLRDGLRYYNTGDVVIATEQAGYLFRGRRDRMVKRRGYRIELGEIEKVLNQHADIRQAAVIATSRDDGDVAIVAIVVPRRKVSIVELKRYSAQQLLDYMTPDRFVLRADLPRTTTDKIDYQKLGGSVQE
jgi:acyl-coenzyme A synthetase/AMP-(fatty) acid ligase